MTFKEDNYEKAVLSLLEGLNYNILCGYDIKRDFKNPLYMEDLERSLFKLQRR